MTPWQEFYQSVRENTWPDCEYEQDFFLLPAWIQQELQVMHGYKPGEYSKQISLPQRRFPIETQTACQLKWNWSTVFLSTAQTASCHRTNQHRFDTQTFDFHNTPSKLQDRQRMLKGLWPEYGCEYCQKIEQAGGQSDRMTNLDFAGMYAPPELEQDPHAVRVTPKILEVYFDNTCDLKCVYCGPHFSSLWDAENKQHGRFEKNGLIISDKWPRNSDIEKHKDKLFDWLRHNGHHLTNFNILGGEPLYQKEFDRCLEHFARFPAPEVDLQIFTNLNCKTDRLKSMLAKVKDLLDQGKLRDFTVTASIDCWGAPQEYARFPLDLARWQQNFELLVEEPWLKLIVGSTITPLTVHTLVDLIDRLNYWRQRRTIYHYFNSVNGPSYMFIDIFGDLFQLDFQNALAAMPEHNLDQIKVKQYLDGIAKQSSCKGTNRSEVIKLVTFLDEIDRRRNTHWREVFPWLEEPIKRITQ
jgi:organic radical activating enzyme